MALSVVLNGNVRELGSATTLAELVAELGLKADRVAVERNGEIVARETWIEVTLQAGDKLEVVHFVGGGCPSPSCCHSRRESASSASIRRTCAELPELCPEY
jgi:sulfur carrier protein